ncbi:MAG: hypothetical protein DRP56_01780 [Planctomycetota bacterium]|nr:MAG: hypothetical protein DRP56_01780 [Planctomycetota bacterium]
MTRNEIVTIVIEKLDEIQELGGEEKVQITKSTKPIGGIPGFDSMNGVEFAAMMDELVHIGEVGNLCASKDSTRALTVDEIADRILEIIPE